jgi:hypothetical protein
MSSAGNCREKLKKITTKVRQNNFFAYRDMNPVWKCTAGGDNNEPQDSLMCIVY